MPDSAILYAVDNLADVDVVVQSPCFRVQVQENYNSASAATADLLQRVPKGAVGAIAIPKGTPAIYTKNSSSAAQQSFHSGPVRYNPGDIAGTIRTTAGAITVQQIESQEI